MPLKVGHHRPASEAPLKWRFADNGPTLNAGLIGSFVTINIAHCRRQEAHSR